MIHYVYRDGDPRMTMRLGGFGGRGVYALGELPPSSCADFYVVDCWHDENYILHSVDDAPVISRCCCEKNEAIRHYWFDHGIMHRSCGPAYIEYDSGIVSSSWIFNGTIFFDMDYIGETIDRLGLSRHWESWTEDEKIMFRLAF